MCFSVIVKSDLSEIESRLNVAKDENIWQELFVRNRQNPKDYQIAQAGKRFFCGDKYYVPVYYQVDSQIICEPMRYGKFYPPQLRFVHKGKRKDRRCNYNTRLDNINSPAWADAYKNGHGFIAIDGFFENVQVKDLVQAGNITLAEIGDHFEKKMIARKEKILQQGKQYTPTKTEQKDPLFRNIVIEFRPHTNVDLLIPVIFNSDTWDKSPFKGFSIITDEPTPEIAVTGHDRSPVILNQVQVLEWIISTKKRNAQPKKILNQGVILEFGHKLDKSA